MKTALVILLAIIGTVGQAAETEKKMDNKARMAHIAMRLWGGKLRQPNSEAGMIAVVNSQKIVDAKTVEMAAARLVRKYHFVINVVDTPLQSKDDCFVIRLEDLDRNECIILAPESGWVSVNVRCLKDDKLPKAIVANRFEKEFRRAFAFVCGGTGADNGGGLCRLIGNASELDAISGMDYSLDVEARLINNMRDTKIKPFRIAKYSDAVTEGWAPAPTNEYQKAIWDKAHAIPKNPIKIEFDPKKGR